MASMLTYVNYKKIKNTLITRLFLSVSKQLTSTFSFFFFLHHLISKCASKSREGDDCNLANMDVNSERLLGLNVRDAEFKHDFVYKKTLQW